MATATDLHLDFRISLFLLLTGKARQHADSARNLVVSLNENKGYGLRTRKELEKLAIYHQKMSALFYAEARKVWLKVTLSDLLRYRSMEYAVERDQHRAWVALKDYQNL